MKRTVLALLVLTAAAAPIAANAQAWQPINQRQANLDQRIDQGVRSGALSRPEAVRLRGEFRSLARLEASYRRDGLSARERADLEARFNRLSRQVQVQKHDRQYRG